MSEESPVADLTFVTTDELWAEICRRFDNAIMGADVAVTPQSGSTDLRWHGNINACLGLASRMNERFLFDVMPRTVITGDGE